MPTARLTQRTASSPPDLAGNGLTMEEQAFAIGGYPTPGAAAMDSLPPTPEEVFQAAAALSALLTVEPDGEPTELDSDRAHRLVEQLAKDPLSYYRLTKAIQAWQLQAHAGQASEPWCLARPSPSRPGEQELLRYEVGAGARVTERWTPNPALAHRFTSLDEAVSLWRLTSHRMPGCYYLMRVLPDGTLHSVPLIPA